MKPLNETDVHGVSSAHPLLGERPDATLARPSGEGLGVRAPVRADVPPSHCPLRAKGECTSWIGTRGFGFVEIPGETRPVFVHCREVPMRDGLKSLKPGETVELSYREQPDKRLRATAVFFPEHAPRTTQHAPP
jgi:cold shock CspA family protein